MQTCNIVGCRSKIYCCEDCHYKGMHINPETKFGLAHVIRRDLPYAGQHNDHKTLKFASGVVKCKDCKSCEVNKDFCEDFKANCQEEGKSIAQKGNTDDCPICLESIKHKIKHTFILENCGHTMHYECL